MSRRDDISAAVEKHDKPIAKTTKGKGRHYQSVEEGAGRPKLVAKHTTQRMVVTYKHPNLVAQDTIVFVQGQQDGQGNGAKRLEQGGNADEKRTICQYSR